MSAHTDYLCERIKDTQAAIEQISELQREIDFSRVAGDGVPAWWNQRHESGLISANRLLAAHAAVLIDELQQSIQEVRHGR